MKNRKLWVSILAGLLAAIMILSFLSALVPRASALSSSEIKKQLEQLQKQKAARDAEIAALEAQLSDNLDEMKAVVAQKDVIDREIAMLHAQLSNINEQIAAFRVLIADQQAALETAEAHLTQLNEKYKERIRAMEEGGSLSYWSVLFKASSFSDLLDRMNMIKEIAVADNRRLTEIRMAAEAVELAKADLEAQKDALELSRAELDAAQQTLDEKRTAADALLADLNARGDEFQQMIDESEERQAALLLQIAQAERDRDVAAYQEWLATSIPTTAPKPSGTIGNLGGSGSAGTEREVDGVIWLTPVDYYHFTSPFGMRIHPIHGDYRMHYGVDLSASTGTPIIASRSGVVTWTDYEEDGAGYYVVINHGDGYSSVYMHMTHYIVKTGQNVSAGQVIGYVGSTGGSTGPHLHFGISYNGTYVNPADYIKI